MSRSNSVLRLAGLAFLVAGPFVSCNKSFDSDDISFLVTTRVSLNSQGLEGHGDAVGFAYGDPDRPAISDDGRYVAFASKAEDLVPGDSNNKIDIFRRDLVTGTTVLISVRNAGGTPNADCAFPSMSGDGRYVSYHTRATDIIPVEDADSFMDIYVRDVDGSTTTLVSRSSGPGGAKGNDDSQNGRLSADGRYIVFESLSNILDGTVGGLPDNDANFDIYRRLILDGALLFPTDLVSTRTDGVKGDDDSFLPWPSADGRFVAFESTATNLPQAGPAEGGPDGNSLSDVFWRDMLPGGITRRVSLGDSTLAPAFTIDPQGGPSDHASISEDGRYVVYHSQANNLVVTDPSSDSDNFVFDTVSNTTKIITLHSTGAAAGNSCNYPHISGDGRFIVFQSNSTNLVSGDSNGSADVFLHDQVLHTTSRVSVATFGKEANSASQHAMISRDGKFIVFYSAANNLVDDDNNGSDDVFVRGAPRN